MLDYFLNRHKRQRARALVELTKKDGLQPGDPRWDGTPATHCNEYAYEAAQMFGYNIEPLLHPKGIGWTSANDMYRNARAAVVEDELKEITGEKAQELVNKGRFCLALAFNLYDGSGHVAVVQRFVGLFPPRKGPKIVQAGAENGEFWFNDIFNLTTISGAMFVELKKKG